MSKISSVCPILFNVREAEYGLPMNYVQKFMNQDLPIIVQIVDSPSSSYSMTLYDLISGASSNIIPSTHVINSNSTLFEFTVSSLGDSLYQLRLGGISVRGEVSSIPFQICTDIDHIKETVLIEYTNYHNDVAFGGVFKIGSTQRYFRIRVEGGFKVGNVKLNVDNEQFRTQSQELINLYAVPYEVSTLTIGDNEGVPFEMARLINNLLCLSDVTIDGVKYVRSEKSVPEQQVIAEDYPQFNYNIELESAENVSYSGRIEYPDGSSIIGSVNFNVDDAADGEVLVFNKNKGSFINQHTLDSL